MHPLATDSHSLAQQQPQLPAFLGRVLGTLPAFPGSLLFVTGLNLVLVRHLPADVLTQLQGRNLRIEITDACLCFDYQWCEGGFKALAARTTQPDLCFRANAWTYLRLIQRSEDPDTLFFNRSLQIEGDTELGLMVKNTLDAIDLSVLQPENVIKSFFEQLSSRMAAR